MKSPRKPDWRAVQSEPRWRGRAGGWSKHMTQQSREEDSMSHVDEGTLHAYLDGELPSSERADVEAHLAECAECRANLAEAKALSSRASDILGRAAPAARPLPAMPRRRRLGRVPGAWAATVVLALGLGYYLHTPDSRTPAEEPSSVAMQANRPAPAIAPAADRSRVQEPVRRRDVRSPRSRENVAAADKAPITMQPVPAGG